MRRPSKLLFVLLGLDSFSDVVLDQFLGVEHELKRELVRAKAVGIPA